MANITINWIRPSKKNIITIEGILIFLFLIGTFFIALFIYPNYGNYGCSCIRLGSGPPNNVELFSLIQNKKLFSEFLSLCIPSLILFYGVMIILFLLENKQQRNDFDHSIIERKMKAIKSRVMNAALLLLLINSLINIFLLSFFLSDPYIGCGVCRADSYYYPYNFFIMQDVWKKYLIINFTMLMLSLMNLLLLNVRKRN